MNFGQIKNVLCEIRFLCHYTPDCSMCEFSYLDENDRWRCFCEPIRPEEWYLDHIIKAAKDEKEGRRPRRK